jgi:hypothetical protein
VGRDWHGVFIDQYVISCFEAGFVFYVGKVAAAQAVWLRLYQRVRFERPIPSERLLDIAYGYDVFAQELACVPSFELVLQDVGYDAFRRRDFLDRYFYVLHPRPSLFS